MGDAEDVKILHRRQRAVAIDRVPHRRIVIARQDHDRQRAPRNDRRGAIKKVSRQAMAIEGIAGEQHHIGGRARGSEHAGQARRAVAAMQPRRIVVIDMQVRTVNDDDIAGGRKRHAR